MSFAVGTNTLARASLASGPLHDPPTVTVTAPTGTVSTGGPNVLIDWGYSQPQGDTQERYRVVVKESGTPVHDSGWLYGATSEMTLDWDALELTGDGSFTVEVEAGAVGGYTDMDSGAFTMAFGTPQLTITNPADGEVWTDVDSVLVEWSTVDPGHTQSAYRIRFIAPATQAVLLNSGWVSSAATSVDVPYLVSGSRMVVEVQSINDQGMRSS